jgi:hypothetical protein
MTRTTKTAALVLGALCIGFLSLHGVAQQQPLNPNNPNVQVGDAGQPAPMFGPPPPATRIEGLAAQKGVLIIKGYSEIGEVQSDDGSRLRMMAVTFTDAKNNREQGLVISLEQRDQQPVVAYVDGDEFDGLSDALDQLSKIENGASVMNNAEGVYHTRGDLEFTNHSSDGAGRMVTVRATQVAYPSGQVLQAQASFRPARLGEIRQQIAQAKESLDHARNQQPAAANK